MIFILRSVIFYCSITWIIADRKVAMIDDLCKRFPKLDFCRNYPPTLPPTPDNQPLDRETYCRKYQLHYTYFCTTDDNQVANAKEFCAAYKNKCNTKDAPSVWSPDQIKEECTKRQALAQQFCTGNESPSIKNDCDLYRQYCQGQAPATSAPALDVNQYCQSNYQKYVQQCQSGAQNPASQAQTPQAQQPQTGGAGGLSPTQITSLCTQNKALATQFCTGNEALPQVKQNCDLFRTYCVGAGGGRRKRQALTPTIQTSADFCSSFVRTCNSLPAAPAQNDQLSAFCQQYQFTVDTFCPAYEIAENRIACNAHRYYCQHKTPFRDIDGFSGA